MSWSLVFIQLKQSFTESLIHWYLSLAEMKSAYTFTANWHKVTFSNGAVL